MIYFKMLNGIELHAQIILVYSNSAIKIWMLIMKYLIVKYHNYVNNLFVSFEMKSSQIVSHLETISKHIYHKNGFKALSNTEQHYQNIKESIFFIFLDDTTQMHII